MNERSRPTWLASHVAVFPFDWSQSASLMSTGITCPDGHVKPAVRGHGKPWRFSALKRDSGMPPVKKPSRDRQKTFLREWRDFRGYTLEQAAEMIGMSRENLGKIEKSRVPYNQDVLELLAEAYNCEVSDLLIRNPIETENIWSIWNNAKQGAKNAIVSFAKTLRSTDETQFINEKTESYELVSKTTKSDKVVLLIDTANGPIQITVPTSVLLGDQKDEVLRSIMTTFAHQASKVETKADFNAMVEKALNNVNIYTEDQMLEGRKEGFPRKTAKS